ncbi:MAG: hypothetical protein V4531_05225 [Actinomycetota bacterium]
MSILQQLNDDHLFFRDRFLARRRGHLEAKYDHSVDAGVVPG